MRLIDADEYEKRIKPYDTEDDMDKALYNFAHYHLVTTPSAQPEITEDDVKEYCRKRCLIVVTSDFYDEMMSRWSSAQPVDKDTNVPCTDTISRQAAIEALKEAHRNNVVTFIKSKEAVSNIPSEDVRENVRGEWIDWSRLGLDGVYVWHRACSKCGYERDDDNIDKDSNFCPNCGADMRQMEGVKK